jgi:hypothetical protein
MKPQFFQQIAAVLNAHREGLNGKLLIPPPEHLSSYIAGLIDRGRLYVAIDPCTDCVVAVKSLYTLGSAQEVADTYSVLDIDTETCSCVPNNEYMEYAAFLYWGMDFTAADWVCFCTQSKLLYTKQACGAGC